MDDGLKYEYLRKVFKGRNGRTPSDLRQHLGHVWWWKGNWGRFPQMDQPSAQLVINQFLDRGMELAYWYECIARCTGEYPFGTPFPGLQITDIQRFYDTTQVEPIEGNMPGLVMHPYEDGRKEADIWMRGPRFNAKIGGYFSDPFLCVFNLKLPNKSILDELSVEIDRLKEEAKLPTKQRGLRTERRMMELLEAWDILRWRIDRPDDPALHQKIPKLTSAGLSDRRTGIGNIRRKTRKRFPLLAKELHKHPPK